MPDAESEENTTELRNVDVQYISLVRRGANRQRFQLFKSQDYDPANFSNFSKGATSFQDLPKADEERDWDASRAMNSIKKWASSDGSGDKDTIDWSKYKRGFFWYNEDEPEKFGSYKLPFAEVLDGELKAVWRGVASAMASLNGARGNRPDIPEDDFEAVYNHIKRYYEKFGEEAPELEKSAEELSKEERGLIEVIKDFLVDRGLMKGDEEVKKEVQPISWQTNFNEALDEVQTREGMERIEFMFDLLKDTIWNIYHLENDIDNPVEAVRDAVEDFANQIVDVINNNQGEIQKWYEEVKKQKEEGGTIDMGEVNQETLEELTKGITSLNDKIEGLSNRLDEVEKEDQNPEGNEPKEGEEVEKSGEEGQEGQEGSEEDTIEKSIQELTDTVSKAVDKLDNLEERVETVEKARDISHDPGDDGVEKNDDGGWASIAQ